VPASSFPPPPRYGHRLSRTPSSTASSAPAEGAGTEGGPRLLGPGDRLCGRSPESAFVGVGRVAGRVRSAAGFVVTTPASDALVLEVARRGASTAGSPAIRNGASTSCPCVGSRPCPWRGRSTSSACSGFSDVCGTFSSEPPRTRTWNLEIKSVCRGVSVRFRGLQIPLK
jgi:hypothetical protein